MATACHTARCPHHHPRQLAELPAASSFHSEVVRRLRQDDGCISPTSASDFLCDRDLGTYFIYPTYSLPVK